MQKYLNMKVDKSIIYRLIENLLKAKFAGIFRSVIADVIQHHIFIISKLKCLHTLLDFIKSFRIVFSMHIVLCCMSLLALRRGGGLEKSLGLPKKVVLTTVKSIQF